MILRHWKKLNEKTKYDIWLFLCMVLGFVFFLFIASRTASASSWVSVNEQVFSGNASASWTDLDLSSYVGENATLVYLRISSSGNPNYNWWGIKTRTNGDTSTGNLWGYDLWGGSPNTPMPIGASDVGLNGRNNANGAYVAVVTDASGIIEWGAYHTLPVAIQLIGYVSTEASGGGATEVDLSVLEYIAGVFVAFWVVKQTVVGIDVIIKRLT